MKRFEITEIAAGRRSPGEFDPATPAELELYTEIILNLERDYGASFEAVIDPEEAIASALHRAGGTETEGKD